MHLTQTLARIGRLFRKKLFWRRLIYVILCLVTCFLLSKWFMTGHTTSLVQLADDTPHGTDSSMTPPVIPLVDSALLVPTNKTVANVPLPPRDAALPCDAECQRFRQRLDVWEPDKPKAAIILLVQRRSIAVFGRSVKYLDANFNDAYGYPIIVFHEPNMDNDNDRRQLRSLTNSTLFFQLVHFDFPDFINRSAVPPRLCFKTVGYRHMCRFQAKTVYDQPILVGLRYVWRLDDDSFILKPIGYDVFALMRDRQILYGFATVVSDYGPCVVGLWPAVAQYIRDRVIKAKFKWPRGRIFWNNFELSDLTVWWSEEYTDYIDYIDRLGGIYYHRWGDATIKTVAVTLFVPKDRTHHFKDIAYKHGKRIKT
jgi:hypothetical protein